MPPITLPLPTEYGYLRGQWRVKQGDADRFLVDIVIESICSCKDEPTDSVQLQVRCRTLEAPGDCLRGAVLAHPPCAQQLRSAADCDAQHRLWFAASD